MSEVTATTDNKVKKPVHRSRSWKNEKRGKLFYDCQKSNKDCDKRSKNSKSVTTSPCRPTDQNFYNSQIHSDLDFHSGDIKPTHYPGVLSPEAISSMSTLCAQTPSTSPSWFYRSSSSCKLMTGKNLDTLKSPLYLSPTSKTVSPTVNSPGGFFTTNTQNKSHQEESGCPVKNSPQTDSTVCHGNYSGSGTSSFMTNLKVAFNRFFDNIRNKNNNIPSNNNNNNTNSNNSDNNTNVTPSRKQSKLHLPSLVKSTVQQFSPSSQPSPTSPFAVSSIVCSSSAESEFQGDFKCRRPDSLCKSKSSVYSPDKMSSGENNTDENKCDNTKELKETELLARTLYATVSREIEIEAKEKRRRQHHSSVGSRPSSHFTCCYHVRPYDNRSNHSSADSPNQSYTEKKVSPGSSYHTDKLGDGINIHNNDSNNHNYDKMNNNNNNSEELYTRDYIPNTTPTDPLPIKQSINSTAHFQCSHCSPPQSFNHRLPVSRPNSNTSPPLTLRQLSTLRSRYEQSEYGTVENETPRKLTKSSTSNQLDNLLDQSEVNCLGDKIPSLSPISILSSLSSMSERPKFYSSNLITLHNPNNNNYYYPDGIRLKYITEQVVLEKSTSSFENKGKMRSYSWSKYSSVNKESDQCESTNNTKKEDEYKEPDSGRPSDCEFNIPFDDIKLVDCLLKGERKAIYKGYWHGEVDVHIFENLSRLERRRFWQDVTRLMMTRHENIALFMGVCVEPPNFAIVTSSCTGVSLYTKLHIKREKLSHSIRLHLLRQIANAITYLHSRTNPIVVRRLSSKNIFLRPKMNLYLTDYSTEDCDYQVPGFVPIQLDCIKYIAPELLLTVEEDIIKLCGETYGCCGGGGGSSAGGGSTSQMPIEWNDDPGETTTTTTHLYPAVKSEQTSKQPILGYIMKLSNPSSELHMTDNNATQDSEILKSWPNLLGLGKNHQSTGSSSSSSTSQLTKKSISLPNLYTNRHTLEDSLKLPYKSVKYISLHKASFIKAIRQFCTTSKQYKIVVKTIYIPVTEFTTSTDIFAFGNLNEFSGKRLLAELCVLFSKHLKFIKDISSGIAEKIPLLNLQFSLSRHEKTIIFELNTRCYPFEEFDICEYIQYLRAGERDEGGEHCIPRSVKNLMQSCWSGDPTKRPSMNTISQELVRSHILYKRQNSDPVPKRSTRYPVNGF